VLFFLGWLSKEFFNWNNKDDDDDSSLTLGKWSWRDDGWMDGWEEKV
jgi:hypothetical protein